MQFLVQHRKGIQSSGLTKSSPGVDFYTVTTENSQHLLCTKITIVKLKIVHSLQNYNHIGFLGQIKVRDTEIEEK